MKSIRTIGLCLIAVFAIGAVAAASASAAESPTFKSCGKATKVGKTYIGHYTSKECTAASKVETGGKYELKEVEGVPVTVKSKATNLTLKGKVVKCKKDKGTGEIAGGEVVFLTFTFEGCAVNGNKKEPCTTTGHAPGTIVTNELIGEPKWINSAETQTGLVVFGLGFEFAIFDCGSGPLKLKSIVVGTATTTKKGVTAAFKVVGGKQEMRAIWEEGEEQTGFGETLPFFLYTTPKEEEEKPTIEEATMEGTEELGAKGVGLF
ncbi:MAG TPA: hypothetical protein VGI52_10185 [Solirubrobacteraceae bacterium]